MIFIVHMFVFCFMYIHYSHLLDIAFFKDVIFRMTLAIMTLRISIGLKIFVLNIDLVKKVGHDINLFVL